MFRKQVLRTAVRTGQWMRWKGAFCIRTCWWPTDCSPVRNNPACAQISKLQRLVWRSAIATVIFSNTALRNFHGHDQPSTQPNPSTPPHLTLTLTVGIGNTPTSSSIPVALLPESPPVPLARNIPCGRHKNRFSTRSPFSNHEGCIFRAGNGESTAV